MSQARTHARMHPRTHHAAKEHDELHVRVDRQPELLLEGPLRIRLDAHGMLQIAVEGEVEVVVRAPFLLLQLLLDAKTKETVK